MKTNEKIIEITETDKTFPKKSYYKYEIQGILHDTNSPSEAFVPASCESLCEYIEENYDYTARAVEMEQLLTNEVEATNREIAIKWWNSLSLDNQYAHTKVYYPKRQLSSLTGREIEEMFTAIEPAKPRYETPPKLGAEEWLKKHHADYASFFEGFDALDMLVQVMEQYASQQSETKTPPKLDVSDIYEERSHHSHTSTKIESPPKLGLKDFLESIGIDIRLIKATRIPITLKEYEGEMSIIELMEQFASQQGYGWVSCEDRLPEDDTMDIYSPEGTKVIYTGKNGYDSQIERANKYLKVGETYTIDHTEVHGWNTDVYLKEVPNKHFNSAHFIPAELPPPPEK